MDVGYHESIATIKLPGGGRARTGFVCWSVHRKSPRYSADWQSLCYQTASQPLPKRQGERFQEAGIRQQEEIVVALSNSSKSGEAYK